MLYHDEAVTAAAESGKIPTELIHRLVRGTISCMTCISYADPFNRYPSSGELEEMAKSLIYEYPCLLDPETKHVNIFLFYLILFTYCSKNRLINLVEILNN